MGLEMVDIVLQTEDAFSIYIADEDMFNIVTVGQYYDYIVAKLDESHCTKCVSSVVFYRLRRAVCSCLGVDRKAIRPDTDLVALLPPRSHKKIWSDLVETSDLVFPPLIPPKWGNYIAALGTGGFVVAALLQHSLLVGYVAVIFLAALYFAASPLETSAFENAATIRSMVELLVQTNRGRLLEKERIWSPDEIWDTLVGIIVNALGVDAQEVTREAKFVADLGAG